ncbi:hypothetical protein [Primorskyibacter sp. 2E233]|uniref:hypothetical protein n=1 Tax=Primorskyibacter sp. 2E233 TaxID=3413431 RepID=UPI003BF373CC
MKFAIALTLLANAAIAEPPKVIKVTTRTQGDSHSFSVTLRHPDTGWDHYADGWRIETEDGEVLGTRVLVHPHETEQPFTRSLGGIAVPEGATRLYVRARCLLDGWNTERTPVTLP